MIHEFAVDFVVIATTLFSQIYFAYRQSSSRVCYYWKRITIGNNGFNMRTVFTRSKSSIW